MSGPDNSAGADVSNEPRQESFNTDGIAAVLLREGLHLTALELHAELLERGKEVPRLRDYFSNPANFESTRVEQAPYGNLRRTGSEQTFDSLDWARYSDDGQTQADDKVAALEFELRKAQDTIKSLRADLTQATESSTSLAVEEPGAPDVDLSVSSQIKPHEKRAVNYLVNEYMLLHDYKLSSVTFAEENDNQDFENWDYVGLNIPKPPSLLLLYRDYGQHTGPPEKDTADADCQVKLFDERRLDDMELEKITLEQEVASVRSRLEDEEEMNRAHLTTIQELETRTQELQERLEEQTALREKAESERDAALTSTAGLGPLGAGVTFPRRLREGAASDEDDGVDGPARQPAALTPTKLDRPIPVSFRDHLISHSLDVKESGHIITELASLADARHSNTIRMISRCLPHIVPNVLLGKREELIPLIVCAANMHPDAQDRDALLRMLFNLIKRPDEEQRTMILSGCLAFAQYNGEAQIEGELLPQCWEQIDNRHHERRILVAQACGCLVPYLSSGLCGSLILSMLSQMLMDEKVDEVRAAIVRSLGVLVSFIDNEDKYPQVTELYFRLLADPTPSVQEVCLQFLLPSVSLWAVHLDTVISSLSSPLMGKLDASADSSDTPFADSQDERTFVCVAQHLNRLLPYVYLTVVESMERGEEEEGGGTLSPASLVQENTPELQSLTRDLTPDWPALCEASAAFQRCIAEEWFHQWAQYRHMTDELIPLVVKMSALLRPHQQALLSQLSAILTSIGALYGKRFMELAVLPPFMKAIDQDEGSPSPEVYGSGLPIVLAMGLYASNVTLWSEELSNFLSDSLCVVALGKDMPRDALWSTFKELSHNPDHHDLLLDVLWKNLLHTESKVKVIVGLLFEMFIHPVSEEILTQKVVPALITLAHDPDVFVKASSVDPLGSIVEKTSNGELLDKVCMQFNAYFEDSIGTSGQGHLHSQLIQTFARVGPNVEPKFRNEVVLPKLALMAAVNNHRPSSNSSASPPGSERLDVAQQLFEAYGAFFCCFIPPETIAESFLPGLKSVAVDMKALAPEHLPVIASMMKELEGQIEAKATSDSPFAARKATSGKASSATKSKDSRGHNSRVTSLFYKKK